MAFTVAFVCAALALLTGGASAIPPPRPSTVGGIFLCSEAHWMGTCGYAVQPLDTCIVLGNDWNKKISSLGPDPGTVVVAYDNANCAGADVIVFQNPGSDDLASLGWNDRISSFMALAAAIEETEG